MVPRLRDASSFGHSSVSTASSTRPYVQQMDGWVGYESVTAFITMFKKALGKPPTQYFSSLRESGNDRD